VGQPFVIVLVVVLVLESLGFRVALAPRDRLASGGEPLWSVFRRPREFVPSRTWPKRAAAGGSRERPSAPQLYGQTQMNRKVRGQCITLGNSRKPPVATFSARWSTGTNIAGSSDTRQSGSPPNAGRLRTVTTCHPVEHEDKNPSLYCSGNSLTTSCSNSTLRN
jgi:hypothetical protein